MVLGNEKGYFFLPWLQRANEGGRREEEGSAFHQSSELPRAELFPEPPLFHCWKYVKRSKEVEEILGAKWKILESSRMSVECLCLGTTAGAGHTPWMGKAICDWWPWVRACAELANGFSGSL